MQLFNKVWKNVLDDEWIRPPLLLMGEVKGMIRECRHHFHFFTRLCLRNCGMKVASTMAAEDAYRTTQNETA